MYTTNTLTAVFSAGNCKYVNYNRCVVPTIGMYPLATDYVSNAIILMKFVT